MPWPRSMPVFYLLLVFLLAADLGCKTLVAANALDCAAGWTNDKRDGPRPWTCSVSNDVTYLCGTCGRHDRLAPSASDCVNQKGQTMNGRGTWTCDVALSIDQERRPDGRQFICYQSAQSDTYFNCKNRNKNQQCPPSNCCLAGNCPAIP